MDPVTHGLTGALIAEAGFSRHLGRHSRLILTGAAMFPDLDIVYRFAGLPVYIANHRALSHSFVGLIVSGILIGGIAGRLDEERRYLPWMAAIWVALFSHQILDLITSYGTVVLYPFSSTRYYFDWVFILDLFLSGSLLVFLIAARLNVARGLTRARTGLMVACGYIAFCALNHNLAMVNLRKAAEESGVAYQHIAAIPQPLLPIRWSGILDAETYYHHTSFFSFQKPAESFHVYPKTTGSFFEQKARSSEMGVLYFWFARYPVVEERVRGNLHIVEFSDLRFVLRLQGFPVRRPFVLHFKMDDAGNIIESRFTRM